MVAAALKPGRLVILESTTYPGTTEEFLREILESSGYTVLAGRCLVATVRRGRWWLGVVLRHSADPPAQAQHLFNAAFIKLRAPTR